MERAEVISRLRQGDVQLVRALFCDNAGLVRGKAVHVDELERRMVTGIPLAIKVQALNLLDHAQPLEGFGAVGEVRLLPDPDTFTVIPYATRAAAMIGDLTTVAGEPWQCCPRGFLKRMVRRALDEGLQIRAGFESEWALAVRVDDRYVPIDETLYLSTTGMQTAAAVVDEVVDALGKQGLRVEQYHAERGSGQQELTIRYGPAVRAADNQLLYRETIRSIAFKNGWFATFAPKPWAEQPGNGCHLHLSIWDAGGGENLFFDRAAPYQLGRLGRYFAAGLLEHMPGLVALTCPSYNSYQRLQPRAGSAAYVCYGPDNREAAVRIVSPLRNDEARSINLELRASDNSANPYIALGGAIAAGLDGIRRGLEPPEGLLALGDPADLPDEEREARGIRRLPVNLSAALDALEADAVLIDALGELARPYIAVRRSEWVAFAAQGSAYEHKHHFWKY